MTVETRGEKTDRQHVVRQGMGWAGVGLLDKQGRRMGREMKKSHLIAVVAITVVQRSPDPLFFDDGLQQTLVTHVDEGLGVKENRTCLCY